VYELEERIEAVESGPDVLISHTVDPYLNDFAVVASFGLGAVVSREAKVVKALTAGHPSFSSYFAPNMFVSRFFDPTIYVQDHQVDDFRSFVTDLLALERRSYLGAMRAMRTFIAGLHRIPDDLALSYTLMVASVESLARHFDAFAPAWGDLHEGKRKKIDNAHVGVAVDTADAVRSAILATEHTSLAQRYRAFVLDHIDDTYFRQTDVESPHPLARYEVEKALRQAYELRSSYIHQLQPLPSALRLPNAYRETTALERRPALTFQGLHRLMRHVIKAFVAKGKKVEREAYGFTSEQAGVVSLELPPQYWLGRPLSSPSEARRRLEGLLSLISAVLVRELDAGLIDIHPMLADVERMLPQAPQKHRPALLCLHLLFNSSVKPELQTPGFAEFLERHNEEATRPGVESVAVATLLDATDEWPVKDHQRALDDYFAERGRSSGLHAPRLVEAAMCLVLAEKYRATGSVDEPKTLIASAVEILPGHARLIELERVFDTEEQIDWRDALLPLDNGEDAGTT
jgi:hypothetical protein